MFSLSNYHNLPQISRYQLGALNTINHDYPFDYLLKAHTVCIYQSSQHSQGCRSLPSLLQSMEQLVKTKVYFLFSVADDFTNLSLTEYENSSQTGFMLLTRGTDAVAEVALPGEPRPPRIHIPINMDVPQGHVPYHVGYNCPVMLFNVSRSLGKDLHNFLLAHINCEDEPQASKSVDESVPDPFTIKISTAMPGGLHRHPVGYNCPTMRFDISKPWPFDYIFLNATCGTLG